jgi:hypothetical protein
MSKFVAWPADFFGYLTALPGVRVVSRPTPVRIGGVRGTQITVQTRPMHPLIWLDGDTGWLGGGPSGVDPTLTRQIILLNVKGRSCCSPSPTRLPGSRPVGPRFDSSTALSGSESRSRS